MALVFLKWVGAGALFVGTAGFGFDFAKKYRKRPLELREIMTALRMLRADIAYHRLPLPESFFKISGYFSDQSGTHQLFAKTAELLTTSGTEAEDAFAVALGQAGEFWSLSAEDVSALRQFSRTIGNTNAVLQESSINAILAELADREKEAVTERDRFEKVYRTTGVLIGVLMVVMLW